MKLVGTSFVKASSVKIAKRRLIALVFGKQKSGKSHLALTAPDGIVYFSMEPGLEGVVEKFNKKDVIIAGLPDKSGAGYPSYIFAKPAAKKDRQGAEYLEYVRTKATPIWEQFITDWSAAMQSDAKTLVVDTVGALYDLGRFAYVGMAGKAAPKDDPFGQKSAALKTLMRSLIGEAYQYDKNCIFLAREKEIWAGGEPSGEFKPDTWDGLPYETQVNIRLTSKTVKDKTIRKAIVVDSRIDPEFAQGLVFRDDEAPGKAGNLNFTTIASVITGSDEKDWL